MSALERTGVWGWAFVAIAVAAMLWAFVVGPFARAKFEEIQKEFQAEDSQR